MKSSLALFMLALMTLPLLLNGQHNPVRDARVESDHQAVCLSNLHAMAVCDAATSPQQAGQQTTQQVMVLVRGQLLPLQPAHH